MAEYFYVSMVRGGKYRLLKGPYPTHGEALDHVEEGKTRAIEHNEKHWWDAFGTCKVTADSPPPAVFGI